MKQIGSSGLDLSWMMGVNLLLAPLSSTLAWGHTVLGRDFGTHSRTSGRPRSTTGQCLKSRTVLLDLGQLGGALSCRRHRHKLCKCYQLSTDCPLCVCITGVGLCSHNGFFCLQNLSWILLQIFLCRHIIIFLQTRCMSRVRSPIQDNGRQYLFTGILCRFWHGIHMKNAPCEQP